MSWQSWFNVNIHRSKHVGNTFWHWALAFFTQSQCFKKNLLLYPFSSLNPNCLFHAMLCWNQCRITAISWIHLLCALLRKSWHPQNSEYVTKVLSRQDYFYWNIRSCHFHSVNKTTCEFVHANCCTLVIASYSDFFSVECCRYCFFSKNMKLKQHSKTEEKSPQQGQLSRQLHIF